MPKSGNPGNMYETIWNIIAQKPPGNTSNGIFLGKATYILQNRWDMILREWLQQMLLEKMPKFDPKGTARAQIATMTLFVGVVSYRSKMVHIRMIFHG